MNERKWNQLLTAARNETAPAPPQDFAADVVRAIRRAGPAAASETLPLFDQLNLLFPRLAWAAAAIIGLSLAADWGLTAAGLPGLGDGVSQISAQWLLTPNGL
ncbi:MAG TPA: hypothetical protein VMB80_08825 [Candidatus Acidoferrum sp.]|nr:hypothetical protein [Candidatus Acidoferrum sp.]